MIGYTPVEDDIRRRAAGADPDARRYADVHRILHAAEVTPGIPFPHTDGDRAVFFFVGITDPDEAAEALLAAETVLGYALRTSFEPRWTEAHDVRHYILTATLPSGLKVDLVARAQYTGGQDTREDAPELAVAAA
jgi:hypothetical protein